MKNHFHLKSLFVLSASLMSLSSFASGLWGEWQVSGGSCNTGNVKVLTTDNTLGVLFDEFGINLAQGVIADGRAQVKNCFFSIAIRPPTGQYLSGFKQLYSGGMIKSKDTEAKLEIRYRLGEADKKVDDIEWKRNIEITADSPNAQFSRTYMDTLNDESCQTEINYQINMRISGQRSDISKFVIGGVDSVDVDAKGPSLCMIPQWKPCGGEHTLNFHRKICNVNGIAPFWLSTVDPNESNNICKYEGPMGRLMDSPREGTRPLYRCLTSTPGDFYNSLLPNCEGVGASPAVVIGHVYQVPGPNVAPIYRCFHKGLKRHMTTLSNTCEQIPGKPNNGFVMEGPLGFVRR
jgi:hypothetical protein